MPDKHTPESRRTSWFVVALLVVIVVGDGWSGRPGELVHQFLLLPFLLLFILALVGLLSTVDPIGAFGWTPQRTWKLAFGFQVCTTALIFYEGHHFRALGYNLHPIASAAVLLVTLVAVGFQAFGSPVAPVRGYLIAAGSFVAGLVLAIAQFPLNYLRSDMLPVILWADTNLLHHISPYTTMYVGGRVYDFPYLPGMLVGYLPFVAAHLDIRWGSAFYVVAGTALVFWAARPERRAEVGALLSLLLLDPYLQYRHDLYLSPHWFLLMASFVLMQRRRFLWSALVLGASMATYQFSWIIFPFVLLYALRRRGWLETIKVAVAATFGALLIVGFFLRDASQRIANNTVGQWNNLEHALAEPLNLSYWLTYLVRPAHLMRVQAVAMVAIFAWALFRGRCQNMTDTLRWCCFALAVFIPLNVIVDGYFYLMLLVPLLLYTCSVNGWFAEPEELPAS